MNSKEDILGNALVVLVVGYIIYWIYTHMEDNRFKRWIQEQIDSFRRK